MTPGQAHITLDVCDAHKREVKIVYLPPGYSAVMRTEIDAAWLVKQLGGNVSAEQRIVK